MGDDLHRPQPGEARKGGMNQLSSSNAPSQNANWTGS
jgi:hypothetical protein